MAGQEQAGQAAPCRHQPAAGRLRQPCRRRQQARRQTTTAGATATTTAACCSRPATAAGSTAGTTAAAAGAGDTTAGGGEQHGDQQQQQQQSEGAGDVADATCSSSHVLGSGSHTDCQVGTDSSFFFLSCKYSGSGMSIPDPDFVHPGSRIPEQKTATKERGEKNLLSYLFSLLPQISQKSKIILFFNW